MSDDSDDDSGLGWVWVLIAIVLWLIGALLRLDRDQRKDSQP